LSLCGCGVFRCPLAPRTVLSRVFAVEEPGRDLFAAAERLALEGIVAKRRRLG